MTYLLRQPCDEAVIASAPASAPCAESSRIWVLATTILGSSMAFIDGTVVNVALPALQADMNATVMDVQWVVEAYALFLAALLLVGGSLGDRHGRRSTFCIGVGLFALASVWCGLAPDMRHLIAARALQGVGAALLIPGSLAIISASFGEEERGRAIGTWSGFTAITTATGPVLGGWLIDHVSWRAVFFINVPLAAVVLVLAFRHVPESRDGEKGRGLDWTGAALATAGLGALVYGLIESSRATFWHPRVILALAGGCAALLIFAFVERRVRDPMLPLGLFRSRNFSGANLLTWFLYAALAGVLFFLPLDLVQVQGYTATAAGAALLPLVLIMFVLSRWSGGLVRRHGSRLPLVVGPTIAALGFALFMRPGTSGSYWTTFFPAMVVLGIGMAVSVAPLTTTVMNAVPEHLAGVASGVNNAVSRTAGLVAVAVFGLVMVHAFDVSFERHLSDLALGPEVRQMLDQEGMKLAGAEFHGSLDPGTRIALQRVMKEAFVFGFRRVMLVATMLALLSALVAWLLIRPRAADEARAVQAP
jgi:EmrB/QacA subfamily drug resistance transporter